MRLCNIWIEEWNCGVELLEVYVVDENILQCICALAWVCDAWNGKWNCDIWFALIYGRNLCKYDWWNWIERMTLWYCYVLWKERMIIKWKFNCSLLYLLSKFWWKLRWEQPQGGDSRMWKRDEAGTPAVEKEVWRGLPQLKKKRCGGDSRKWKRIWAGTPAFEKEKNGWDSSQRKRIYGGDSRNWNDDMVGTPTIKGLGLQQMYGVANLISKHERGAKIGITRLITRVRQTV